MDIGDGQSPLTFEDTLKLLGFGKFHWKFLIVNGWAYMTFGYQSCFNGFVTPSLGCDFSITSEDQGVLNAGFLLGGILSAGFWGLLADRYGRRRILIIAFLLDAILTAVSSLSQSFLVFTAFRFLNGFVIGAGSITLTYLSEFLSPRHRTTCLLLMGSFFITSWILLPLVSMAILPISWSFQTPFFTFNAWRLFTLASMLPSFLTGVMLWGCFPESPKFLYSCGEILRSLEVLENVYKQNFGKDSNFPVKTIIPAEEIEGTSREELTVWSRILSILKPPLLKSTLIANALMFSAYFGYYGLGLWLPELLIRFEVGVPSAYTTVEELSAVNATNLTIDQDVTLGKICNSAGHFSAYRNTFIIGVSCVVGNAALSLLSQKKNCIKILTVVTMGLSGLLTMSIYFVSTSLQILLVSCLFLTFSESATMVIQAGTCYLFPTEVRGFAGSVAWISGRFGSVVSNLVIGYYIDSLFELPVFLMAATFLFGAGVGFFLPREKEPSIKVTATG